MLLASLLTLLACDGPRDAPPDDSALDDSALDDSAPDDSDPDDSGDPVDPPTLEVDVLIIGAGPAGLSAAYEAEAAGASVVILEMSEQAGGAGWYARNFFGAGTRAQAEAGVVDSPEAALAEWATFTHGGDPDDPWVQALVTRSAEILDWMQDEMGAEVLDVGLDAAAGSAPRAHTLDIDGVGPVAGLVAAEEHLVWLEHRADALRLEDGAVVGAAYTDLRTGEAGWIAADATIVATGGFARDPERVLVDRPELDGLTVLFEHYYGAVAGGHGLLEEAGAAFAAPGGLGVYVHSVPDPREALRGEALLPNQLPMSLIVDLDGQRVADEQEIRSTYMFEVLLEAPDRRLLALMPPSAFEPMRFGLMAFNWAELGAPEELSAQEAVDLGAALRFETLDAVAAHYGISAEALLATVERYDGLSAAREDLDFGKPSPLLAPFNGGAVYVMELAPGLAKAFGGVTLDTQARVVGLDGAPIPGLFAAGEVAGMLGTEAVGIGFTGSMTAVILTGRVAGQEAARAAR